MSSSFFKAHFNLMGAAPPWQTQPESKSDAYFGADAVIEKSGNNNDDLKQRIMLAYRAFYDVALSFDNAESGEEINQIVMDKFRFQRLGSQDKFITIEWVDNIAKVENTGIVLHASMIQELGENPDVLDIFKSESDTYYVLLRAESQTKSGVILLAYDDKKDALANGRQDETYQLLVSPWVLGTLKQAYIKQ